MHFFYFGIIDVVIVKLLFLVPIFNLYKKFYTVSILIIIKFLFICD